LIGKTRLPSEVQLSLAGLYRIHLDKHHRLPLYVQLKEQIKSLIIAGGLLPGDPLPGVRTMAAMLGVNQNTILKTLQDLAREGFVEISQGKRTCVASPPTNYPTESRTAFQELVNRFVEEATELGVPPDMIVAAVIGRTSQAAAAAAGVKGLLVDGNPETAQRYAQDLEKQLGIPFTGVHVQPLETHFDDYRELFLQTDLVVTPAHHRPEVEAIMERHALDMAKLYTIGIAPMMKAVRDLLNIAPHGTIAVLAQFEEDARALGRSIAQAHAGSGETLYASVLDDARAREVIGQADIVVVSPRTRQKLRCEIPPEKRVVTFVNDVDESSMAMLQDAIRELTARRTAPGGG
jgi:GntR family transcriptional regulator